MILNYLNNTFKLIINKPKFFNSKDWHIKHITDNYIKAQRKNFLNLQLLNKTKQVMYAEKRPLDSTVFGLRKQGKCPGVIQATKDHQEIDIVLDGARIKKIHKRIKYALQPLYIRYQGEQIKCMIKQVQMYSNHFIIKTYLKRFIPGQPIKLTIPIILTNIYANNSVQMGDDLLFKHKNVDIICYNQDWPTCFTVDISYTHSFRPYRLGDLANTFPPGIFLDPKINKNDKLFKTKGQASMDPQDVQEILVTRVQSAKKKGKQAAGGSTGANTTGAGTAATGTAKKQSGQKKDK